MQPQPIDLPSLPKDPRYILKRIETLEFPVHDIASMDSDEVRQLLVLCNTTPVHWSAVIPQTSFDVIIASLYGVHILRLPRNMPKKPEPSAP